MAKKIAKVDADAMNSLYAAEMSKMAAGIEDTNGAPKDPQAFKDHEEYLALLQSVLKEDEKVDGSPNDPIKD